MLTSYAFLEYTRLFFIIDSLSAILLKGISLNIWIIFIIFFPRKYGHSTFLPGSQVTASIHWSCYCIVHVYVMNLHMFFYRCLYILPLEIQYYQEWRVGIPLTWLTPLHLCACPKPGHRFPMSVVFVPLPSQDIYFQCQWSLCLFQVRT